MRRQNGRAVGIMVGIQEPDLTAAQKKCADQETYGRHYAAYLWASWRAGRLLGVSQGHNA
ncbi:hypothetical protein ACODT5_32765 [Streptomyces sp. 5.8]|uniref:hypothetical protein n=1 Tax=Streptomyces sp. 5.8 TaxID=3406571 RepID=UPI003BB5C376